MFAFIHSNVHLVFTQCAFLYVTLSAYSEGYHAARSGLSSACIRGCEWNKFKGTVSDKKNLQLTLEIS